jgi:GNAT superfamily N-acetyltransferase
LVIRLPATSLAFRADRYELTAVTGQSAIELSAVNQGEAADLAVRLSAIPPWSTYCVAPSQLERLFRSADGAIALAVRIPNRPAPVGIAVIRWPWLIGPYMQFLGLDPENHGQGLGSRVLHWMEAEAKLANARNMWICAAGFNDGAQRLYERFGFRTVAALDDLIRDGVPEILMRKRLI